MDPETRIRAALERICARMEAMRARRIVKSLARGAKSSAFDKASAALGFPVPADLRALWSIHNGQGAEGDPFVGGPRIGALPLELLSVSGAVAERVRVLRGVEGVRASAASPADLSCATAEELASNEWLAFAAYGPHALVRSALSGRIFFLGDGALMLRAPSLADWLEGYAAELEAGEYVFEARTGRLTRRNPEAERKAAEAAKRAVEHARIRREMALVDQMHLAIADKDEARCLQVLEDARARNEAASFDGAVAALFAAKPGPAFVAGIVRPFLRELVLEPDQWFDVAIGGVLMTNNAIRDIALGHRKDLSIDDVRKRATAVGRTA